MQKMTAVVPVETMKVSTYDHLKYPFVPRCDTCGRLVCRNPGLVGCNQYLSVGVAARSFREGC